MVLTVWEYVGDDWYSFKLLKCDWHSTGLQIGNENMMMD